MVLLYNILKVLDYSGSFLKYMCICTCINKCVPGTGSNIITGINNRFLWGPGNHVETSNPFAVCFSFDTDNTKTPELIRWIIRKHEIWVHIQSTNNMYFEVQSKMFNQNSSKLTAFHILWRYVDFYMFTLQILSATCIEFEDKHPTQDTI